MILFGLFYISCSSNDDALIGKWKNVLKLSQATSTQICTYSINKTETCDINFSLNYNGDIVVIEYIITQEWYLDKDVLVEKFIDSRIRSITYDGENLYPKDELYNTLSSIVLGRIPNGMTLSRKVKIEENTFELFEKESSSIWTRMK